MLGALDPQTEHELFLGAWLHDPLRRSIGLLDLVDHELRGGPQAANGRKLEFAVAGASAEREKCEGEKCTEKRRAGGISWGSSHLCLRSGPDRRGTRVAH